MSKIVMTIIGVVILFIMFPMLMTSIDAFQTAEYTETESGVTTGAGVTTANVTLNKELWQDDEGNVTSITSNITGESPTADSYVTTTKLLTVAGLDVSETRTLIITYEYESLSDTYTGLKEFTRLSPFLIMVAILFVVLGGTYKAFKSKD